MLEVGSVSVQQIQITYKRPEIIQKTLMFCNAVASVFVEGGH